VGLEPCCARVCDWRTGRTGVCFFRIAGWLLLSRGWQRLGSSSEASRWGRMGGSFQHSISVRSARCMRYPARRASGTRQPSRTFSNLLKRFSSGEALRRERRTEKVVPPTSAGANTLQAKRPAGANHRERKSRRPARVGHRKRGVHQLVLLYLVWWVGVPPMCRRARRMTARPVRCAHVGSVGLHRIP